MDASPDKRPCIVCGGRDFAFLVHDEGYDWETCRGCGLVRLVAALSFETEVDIQDETVAANYIRSYDTKAKKKLARSRRRLRVIRRHVKRGRFLDIGSNYGFMTEVASAAGFDTLGLEINPALIAVARQHFPGRRFECGAVETHDFGPEAFDAVYCSEVIEHVVDPRRFLQRVGGVMRSGAVLFLTTPHIREHRRTGYKGMKAPDHKLYFNNANLKRLLLECGFERVRFAFNPFKGIILTARRAG